MLLRDFRAYVLHDQWWNYRLLRLAKNCNSLQSFSVHFCLEGYFWHTWNFISFFWDKNWNLQTFERTSSSSSSMALQPRGGPWPPLRVSWPVYITMYIISPTINLVLVIPIYPPETSSSEAGEKRVRNMAAEFCLRASFHAHRVLLHAVNVQHGTDGFTYPPKEGVLRILSSLKSIVLGRVWTREPWVQWQAR
jgi:hypothetical protein